MQNIRAIGRNEFAKIRTTETDVAGRIFVLDGDPTPTYNQQVLFLAFGCRVINRQEKITTSSSIFKCIEIPRYFVEFLLSLVLSVRVPELGAETFCFPSRAAQTTPEWCWAAGRTAVCDLPASLRANQVPRVFRVLRHSPQAIFSLISLLGSRNSVLASSGVRQKSFD